MPSSYKKALARAGAMSAAHISASHRSCEEGRAHILASRQAIERSLELLRSTIRWGQPPDLG